MNCEAQYTLEVLYAIGLAGMATFALTVALLLWLSERHRRMELERAYAHAQQTIQFMFRRKSTVASKRHIGPSNESA